MKRKSQDESQQKSVRGGESRQYIIPRSSIDQDYIDHQTEKGIKLLSDDEVDTIILEYIQNTENKNLTNSQLATRIIEENPDKNFQMTQIALTGKITFKRRKYKK